MRDKQFITTSYMINGVEFYCEIRVAGEKSTAIVFDSSGKMRAERHLNIPAKAKIYVVEEFIIAHDSSNTVAILKIFDPNFRHLAV